MPSSVESLFWISAVAAAAPLAAGILPRRLVPEVVLLLGAGVLIGPFGWGVAEKDEAIGLLSELGLAMLFLLAGYEIKPKELAGREGGRALLTWVCCLLLALGITMSLSRTGVLQTEIAVAIALTSTALGTLLPILRDSGRLGTPVGSAVLRHGAYGELGPVIAMAVLLGARGPWVSLVVLGLFAVVAVLMSLPTLHLRGRTSRLLELIRLGSETTGQIPVRLTLVLLVSLVTVAQVFELDVVLAAFAAGFILRLSLPTGDDLLEKKLDGISFGFLIPVFFVTSGMAIDPTAISEAPGAFAAVIGLILLVRGVPVFVATRFAPAGLSTVESTGVALFAATGLPIIVAVTSVAVTAGEMSTTSASLLVGAGATTVLLLPMAAGLLLGESRRGVDQTARGNV